MVAGTRLKLLAAVDSEFPPIDINLPDTISLECGLWSSAFTPTIEETVQYGSWEYEGEVVSWLTTLNASQIFESGVYHLTVADSCGTVSTDSTFDHGYRYTLRGLGLSTTCGLDQWVRWRCDLRLPR